MSVLSTLLTAINLSFYVMTVACNGIPVQSELIQMAVTLPREDIYNMHLDACKVEDYNGDGVPEVYLAAASGWEYHVYYYLEGEMRAVEDLEPWAWSSDLCTTADGRLVLYACAHTMGTAGYAQHRIYEWTDEGYHLTEDLWSVPEKYDGDGMLLSCVYLSSKTPIDPTASDVENGIYADILIPQEEYQQKIDDMGSLTSFFKDGLEWDWDFWQENDYDDDFVMDGIYREIQEEILNWQ